MAEALDETQSRLVRALIEPGHYPHPVEAVVHLETHISHVLLAGHFAYKIKKPLDLGFLDFSTLERRRRACEEELRLNRRLAPTIYLEVVPITGSTDAPIIGGDGEPIEYAVKMVRFDDRCRMDRELEADRVDTALIERAARQIAAFHDRAAIARPESGSGTPEAVISPMRENVTQIREHLSDRSTRRILDRLADWIEDRYEELAPALATRRMIGRVRECHGDMHLANMVHEGDHVLIFDGIEFDPALYWIDVASDIAFLVMDLDARGEPALAARALDAWLAATGDYAALQVIRLYLVYRAMVRAKVAAIRGHQADGEVAAEQFAQCRAYLRLAGSYAAAEAPALLITRGVSGSGKSTAAAIVVERIGAVRIRSDVERLRIYAETGTDERYSTAADDVVHQRLETLARLILEAGWPAVVDATFIRTSRRTPFRMLAEGLDVPFRILDMEVHPEMLESRLDARSASADPSEAGAAVMRDQLANIEALGPEEADARIGVDNTGDEPRLPELGLQPGRIGP